jgi:hypothetical protein
MAAEAARLGTAYVDAAPLIAVSVLDGIHYEAAALPRFGQAMAGEIGKHFG